MVQLAMRKMIESEPLKKPLSDCAISQTLRDKGFRVVRRTVTKYCEVMWCYTWKEIAIG